MHSEHKVVRLEREVLHVNYTYLLDQMVPEMVVTQLVTRRLLTLEKMKEVMDKSDWNQRLTTILDAVLTHRVVGTLPTLCAALRETLGHEQCGKKLHACECVCNLYTYMYAQNVCTLRYALFPIQDPVSFDMCSSVIAYL